MRKITELIGFILLLAVNFPLHAEEQLPCGVVHVWTEDYLGIRVGSMRAHEIEYYHWTRIDGEWHGEFMGGLVESVNDRLAGDDTRLKYWINRVMTAETVGDYRDAVLLPDGERCPGFNARGFPE